MVGTPVLGGTSKPKDPVAAAAATDPQPEAELFKQPARRPSLDVTGLRGTAPRTRGSHQCEQVTGVE